jgi:hypothetical protein
VPFLISIKRGFLGSTENLSPVHLPPATEHVKIRTDLDAIALLVRPTTFDDSLRFVEAPCQVADFL